MLKIGYASLVKDLPKANFKTVRLSNFTDDKLRELIKHNLESLNQITEYNIKHGIRMFRISSSLIPFGSLAINTLDWQEEFKEKIEEIRNKLFLHQIRFSVHPGQYTVLNSLDETIVENAILELEYHVKVLESFGGTQVNKMILHIGGVYGDKPLAMQRFIDVANNRLSSAVRRHLVLENDERSYTAEEVLFIAKETKLPMVFDNLHHKINPSLESLSDLEWIQVANQTWTLADGDQKIHYSQQAPNKRPGAHSQTIDLEIFKQFSQGVEADMMLEVKDKNRSVLKTQLLLNPNQKDLEQEWARYKYLVMSKSYALYSEIRQLFSGNKEVDVLEFYIIVDKALELDDSLSQEIVVLEHVWGYFKKLVEPKTKDTWLSMMIKFKAGSMSTKRMRSFLYNLAEDYDQTYLLDSYYFKQ